MSASTPTTSTAPTEAPIVAITRAIPGQPRIAGASIRMAPALPQMPRAELLAYVRGCSVAVTMFHDRVDDEFLDAAGPSLRGVCNFAVGYDNIDRGACARRGIPITNTPDAVTEGTANLAWGLLLAAARRLCEGDRFVRSGRFEREGNIFPTGWMGMHLTGQLMVIVGAGRIGRAVALRALGFGMRIAYVSRSRHLEWELAPLAATRMELEDALQAADVISIHTPLTPETRHLLNRERLSLLKPTAIVLNTARGPIIDEAALVEVLRERKIWAAGLDVFEHEPKVHQGLLSLENVVMAPHIGSAEQRYRELMTEMVCENTTAILGGRRPPNLVPYEPA